ncbi:MAG: hypothetical protein ABI904_10470 [Chloroflexota bacterium]
MSYSINYDEMGFIRLTYEGDANLSDMKEVLSHGALLAAEKSCFRVLSDFRAMKLDLSVMELFRIPENQKEQSRELKMHFAKFRRVVVVPERDFNKYKFFENVAVNRAHRVKIFTDIEEAIEWLLEK